MARAISSDRELTIKGNVPVRSCPEESFPKWKPALTPIAQLVERRTGVLEGVSSNPVRVNSFSVDVSSV